MPPPSELKPGRSPRRPSPPGATLAYLTGFHSESGWRGTPFYRRIFFGAEARALQLGYRLEHFWLRVPGVESRRFAEILEQRGIRGLLIAPSSVSDGRGALPWERFSAVAIDSGLVDPVLHSACSNDYPSTLLLLAQLRAAGYRRFGLVLDPDFDLRHQRTYQAAFAIDQAQHAREDERLAPLLRQRHDPEELRAWLRAQQPDVVISHDDEMLDHLRALPLAVPQQVGFASLVRSGRPEVSGIETHPEQTAALAVDRLNRMLHENETGIPERPTCVMSIGSWVPGATIRVRLCSRPGRASAHCAVGA